MILVHFSFLPFFLSVNEMSYVLAKGAQGGRVGGGNHTVFGIINDTFPKKMTDHCAACIFPAIKSIGF